MVIFGRSLFGGATPGHVLVMGLASALVVAEAVPEVTRLGHGDAQTSAPVVAQATKTQFVAASTSVSAAVAGAAKAEFAGYGSARSSALGRAQTSVEYFLAGQANSSALTAALASKRMRVPTALMNAYAYGEGDGQNYQFANTAPMVGKATGFGTTYYVGEVAAKAVATGEGSAAKKTGAHTQGQAFATVTGECLKTAGAQTDGRAYALEMVDAAVTRSTVRGFECFGFAESGALARLSHTEIYQIQVVSVWAEASRPNALQSHGAKGRAIAGCAAQGFAESVATAVTAKPGNSRTLATGLAAQHFAAQGAASSSAQGEGGALITRNVTGAATPQATVQLNAVRIAVQVIGKPTASLQGTALRTAVVRGAAAQAAARLDGFMQVNDLTKAPANRTIVLTTEDRLVSIDAQPRLILI